MWWGLGHPDKCGVVWLQWQDSKKICPQSMSLHGGEGQEGSHLPSSQPGSSQPKGSDYNCNCDMASPESLVHLTCSVPKAFTLCPAELLAKLLMGLPEQV